MLLEWIANHGRMQLTKNLIMTRKEVAACLMSGTRIGIPSWIIILVIIIYIIISKKRKSIHGQFVSKLCNPNPSMYIVTILIISNKIHWAQSRIKITTMFLNLLLLLYVTPSAESVHVAAFLIGLM